MFRAAISRQPELDQLVSVFKQLEPSRIDAAKCPCVSATDVALDGDPISGYSIYSTDNSRNPAVTGWFVVGGTSAGAPGWAAFAALYNQFAKSLGRGNLGFANPTLYDAAANAPFVPYHDIVNGNNLVYHTGQGWDYPTGWGTPDVATLVSDILVARSPLRGLQRQSHEVISRVN